MGEREGVASVASGPGVAVRAPHGRVVGWLAMLLTAGGVMVALGGEEGLPVVGPAMALILVATVVGWQLWLRSSQGFPFFEIGVVYLGVVTLYGVYPMFGFLANGLRYTPFNDNRLYSRPPLAEDIEGVGWYYVAHLAAFGLAYAIVRGMREVKVPSRGPDRNTLVVAVYLYLCVTLFFLFLGRFFDLSAETYAGSYLAARRLPLALAQLANHLGGARFTLTLLVLTALFFDYRRWRWVIWLWLGVMTVLAFQRLGSRTELVLICGSSLMLYHHLVRRLRFGHVLLVAGAGLAVFVLLGQLRGGLLLSQVAGGINPFARSSEFEVIFGNAVDLSRRTAEREIGALPLAFYLSDLLALVPQQIVPLTKISPADWYVGTFYPDYAARGGGLAFGTLAESVLGWGWIDAALRGAALGVCLAALHRYCARRGGTVWRFVLYVWATVLVYQAFRNTTFSLAALFLYRFLPIAVVVGTLSAVARVGSRGHQTAGVEEGTRVEVSGVA